jgi:hypothetical protein
MYISEEHNAFTYCVGEAVPYAGEGRKDRRSSASEAQVGGSRKIVRWTEEVTV